MSYDILIRRRAKKDLAQLSRDDYERAKESIGNLSDNPRPPGSKKLSGRDGWRIRAGDYRVIYEIDDPAQTVTVLHVGHRRDIYK
jgi:mRNA interferase RelE/StbE